MRVTLRAIAKMANIRVGEATKTVRHNPLFGDEIQLDEELINLEETMKSYQAAAETLENYPKLRRHMQKERRLILEHCIGMLSRMMRGWRVAHEYTEKDVRSSLRKLVQLMIDDSNKMRYAVDEDILEALRPFMSLRQRFTYRTWSANPFDHILPRIKPLYRRLAAVIPLL